MEIIVKNVTKKFYEKDGVKLIFSNINLTVNQNNTYAIIGNSGVGKSALLHLLGGIDSPTTGHISLLHNEGEGNVRSGSFSFVFQEHNLLAELSVRDNLILPLLVKNFSASDAYTIVIKLLETLSMASYADKFVYQLSGGQRQRVSVIRAVVQKVDFILADEPTANLDPENANLVIELLLKVKKEFGTGLIICTHDPAVYQRMDYLICIENENVKIISSAAKM